MLTTLEHIQAILSTTPERWQRLVNTLPTDLLSRQPAPGEWSALDCLQHILNAERVLFPVRVRSFLAGQNFTDFDPQQRIEDADLQTPEQQVAAFTRYRQENLTMIAQLKEEDLQHTVQHPKLGTVLLAQMLRTWAAHDLNHTVQAERALMQPFIVDCGPWHTFFKDHEVDAAQA